MNIELLLNTIRRIVKDEVNKALVDVEKIGYGTISNSNSNGTFNVKLLGGDLICNDMINKSHEALKVGDAVMIKSKNGNAGNGYIAIKLGL